MNFVKVALFALLLVALLVPVSTPSVSAGTDERCEEHHTDYSVGCRANPENTRCGSFCFYAVCHECTVGYHCEGHYHRALRRAMAVGITVGPNIRMNIMKAPAPCGTGISTAASRTRARLSPRARSWITRLIHVLTSSAIMASTRLPI